MVSAEFQDSVERLDLAEFQATAGQAYQAILEAELAGSQGIRGEVVIAELPLLLAGLIRKFNTIVLEFLRVLQT